RRREPPSGPSALLRRVVDDAVDLVFLDDIGAGRVGVEHLVRLGLVVRHGFDGEIGIFVAPGVVLDAQVLHAQAQIDRAPAPDLADHFGPVFGVEFPHRLDRHRGAAILPEFEAQKAALDRVDVLQLHRRLEPGQREQHVAEGAQRGGAAHDALAVRDGVVALPGFLVGVGPFFARHARMFGADVMQVVVVEVGLEEGAGAEEFLVILRTGKRREVVDLEHVDRQFAHDHVEVVQDRFRGVGREAGDVAGIDEDAGFLPFQQHLAVFGDLVLLLLRRDQVGGVDVLQPDIDALDAGAAGLVDEVRQLVAQRVDLDDEAELHLFVLTQLDDAVEYDLPVLVAREIVVGDEEAVQSVGDVAADDLLDVVGRAAARLAALHVDDGAERSLVGAAAAGVEARLGAAGALDALARQKRDWRAFETGKVVHVIVERLERAGIGVAQYLVEAALGLAGIDRQAHRLGLTQRRVVAADHRDDAGHVEAADRDLDAPGAKRSRNVEGARRLVRLHTDQHHHAVARGFDRPGDAVGADAGVGFVERMDFDVD